MAIQLNVSPLNTNNASQAADVAVRQQGTASAGLASVLGGKSLTVTSGALTDLEKLVARLRSESERAKFSLLLTSLSSINQSLTDQEKRILEQGLALSEKLDALTKTVLDLDSQVSEKKGDLLVLQSRIDALQKQIDQAVADGKAHNELVAEMKELRAEEQEKEQAIADTQGKAQKAKNEIASVKAQISVLVKSLGDGVVKTIATELATLAAPEKAERPSEAKKEEEKEIANDPFAAIRASLAEIGRDIAETIAENREDMV